MGQAKNVLVVAHDNKTEALRMASGLTLLDDPVRVLVLGELPVGEEVTVQLESLEFAEVPLDHLDDSDAGVQVMAQAMVQADTVFVV